MIFSGLLSVTFRKLAPVEIVELVSKAGLQAIEWGGDIHVPRGDLAAAAEVGRMMRDSGLRIPSYGSYYRSGALDSPDFKQVLETAVTLGAPAIRIWAGNQGSAESDTAYRQRVVEDTARVAALAAEAGVTVDYEYHRNTLTDTTESALALLQAVGHPALRCNWQPQVHETPEQRLQSLLIVEPWLTNIHVFQWQPGLRLPLADGKDEWLAYASAVRETGRDHYMMLEFVKDDSPEQFLRDAETLKQIIG